MQCLHRYYAIFHWPDQLLNFNLSGLGLYTITQCPTLTSLPRAIGMLPLYIWRDSFRKGTAFNILPNNFSLKYSLKMQVCLCAGVMCVCSKNRVERAPHFYNFHTMQKLFD